jgi:uncharacterized membrane protein
MSIPAGVDRDAPVRARHQTDIDAPLDTVWQLHADGNAWPAWQTDITAANIMENSSPAPPSSGPATASPSSRPSTR